MHVLRFERRGYRPQELGVEVTEIDNAPRLDEVKINFDLTSELADAYMRGKELAQQEKYSEALPELRRVETEIPHYEDIDELIALCSRHLARGKELDKKFNEAMKHFRDGNWEKVVELLSQLPEDYEKSSQAFGVLADARDKLKAKQRLRQSGSRN